MSVEFRNKKIIIEFISVKLSFEAIYLKGNI